MALNFPSNPNLNDTYTYGTKTWTYVGNTWNLTSSPLSTTSVSEGTNLYFSNARVYANVSQIGYVTSSYTGDVSITGNLKMTGMFTETANVIAAAPGANTNVNLQYGSVFLYTANASSNVTLNLTGLTSLGTGNVTTAVVGVTNGATPYYISGVQVDGTTANVTTKWAGGSTPTGGNASNIDVYSFNIIKTNTLTYTILAQQSQFGG